MRQGVDRFALVTDLEVQLVAVRTGRTQLGNHLTQLDTLPLSGDETVIVGIGGNEIITVPDDDQFAVADQTFSRIYHHAIRGGLDRVTPVAGYIKSLAANTFTAVTLEQRAAGGPPPFELTTFRRGLHRRTDGRCRFGDWGGCRFDRGCGDSRRFNGG